MTKKAPRSVLPVTEPEMQDVIPDQQAVAVRAYELWMIRGCPIGSPEVDWGQAEQELLEGARDRHRGQSQFQAA